MNPFELVFRIVLSDSVVYMRFDPMHYFGPLYASRDGQEFSKVIPCGGPHKTAVGYAIATLRFFGATATLTDDDIARSIVRLESLQ